MAIEWWAGAALAAVLGLLVGSFLNVVIHRLPIMLERRWAQDCAEAQAAPTSQAGTEPPAATDPPLNLATPRSRCPHCGAGIAWYQNVPVLSYLVLRGRCAHCQAPISARYPLVELLNGGLYTWVFVQWGATPTSLAWMGFVSALLALAFIDWDTTLLPDDITLPLVWAGLLVALLGWSPVALSDAVWGAVGGYLSLWSVYWAFKLATGKEGMGYGDFKLFAALGAWFGWTALVPMILMASLIGAVVGIALKFTSGLREGGYVPFGPFLAFAGLFALLFGPQRFLTWLGL
jgi:leader peptidase (prepilin peptidase)/N-methyltransferase